ncbi:hypothetical protein BaRGS_00020590 [Batillaria attramentaria]|uniref:Uncharacterized protein n=1 Tax=Batillaria attramentaria TaxID=370345 RepID=A0ABD0KM90_9CAEN
MKTGAERREKQTDETQLDSRQMLQMMCEEKDGAEERSRRQGQNTQTTLPAAWPRMDGTSLARLSMPPLLIAWHRNFENKENSFIHRHPCRRLFPLSPAEERLL